jgi:hypothetical protein
LISEGEALAAEFEHKAATRSWLVRWWYRSAARSLRRDLERIAAEEGETT